MRDYLKTQEPELSKAWNKFDGDCEKLYSDLLDVNKLLDKDFKAAYEDHCGKCLKKETNIDTCNVKMTQSYEKLVAQITELNNYDVSIHQALEVLRKKPPQRLDAELLGRPYKEQNEIIVKRLMEFEIEMKLIHKVRKNYLAELEVYQNKTQEEVDGNTFEYLVASRKSQYKRIEDQVNAEVRRIENVFLENWYRLSSSKKRYEINDWEMRTELLPKITILTHQIFIKGEEDLKLDAEVKCVQAALEERLERDKKFTKDIENFQYDFDELTKDITAVHREKKNLAIELAQVPKDMKAVKEHQKSAIKEINEQSEIDKQIKEVYISKLKKLVKKSSDETKCKLKAADCVISELKESICQASRCLRESKIQISKLKTDLDHFLAKGTKETKVQDLLGSTSIRHL